MRSSVVRWFTFVLLCSPFVAAQTEPNLEQGMKPFGSYHAGGIDTVSLANCNLFVHADLFTYSQRGGELAYPIALKYNSKNFSLYQSCCGRVARWRRI